MKRNEAEIITKHVVDILEQERISRGVTKLQISQNTGMSRTAITLIADKKNSPTLRSLLMLSSEIGVDIKEIIARAEKQSKII